MNLNDKSELFPKRVRLGVKTPNDVCLSSLPKLLGRKKRSEYFSITPIIEAKNKNDFFSFSAVGDGFGSNKLLMKGIFIGS